jgi:hypothetical protein
MTSLGYPGRGTLTLWIQEAFPETGRTIVRIAGALLSKDVLLAPHAVTTIDWLNREIVLNVTRQQLKSSSPRDPL